MAATINPQEIVAQTRHNKESLSFLMATKTFQKKIFIIVLAEVQIQTLLKLLPKI